MKITMPIMIEAADTERRTITGRIVPWNEVGNTSAGRVVFRENSINIADPSKIFLLSEHTRQKPIGKMTNVEPYDNGLMATFKYANTTAGNDHLIEAAEGLRPGLSVGVIVRDFENVGGTMFVNAADLQEVSQVHKPAFESAEILDVVASENPEPSPDGAEPAHEKDTDMTEPVNETVAVAEVTAAESGISTAPAGVAYTSPRSPIIDGNSYLEHAVKAANGDRDSAIYIAAADDSTANNTGLTLPRTMQEFVTTTFSGRPAISAIRSERLIDDGMSFNIPTMVGGTAPTVAETAEAAAPSETGMTSSYQTVNVKKYAGRQVISVELIDRSSPAFFNELLREMRKAYEKATDAAVVAALTSGGTLGTGVAATAAGLQSFIATESAAAYSGTGGDFAENLLVSADQWAAIMGYADTTGRALYTAANPSNNPGVASPTSTRGSVLGLNLIVDHNISTSGIVDNSAFIISPEAVTWYESPVTELRANLLNSGEVEVMLYAYGAIAVKKAAGIRRWNTV
jgi:HK97 family phage major capsid protein/HK97 family phage prohead protease